MLFLSRNKHTQQRQTEVRKPKRAVFNRIFNLTMVLVLSVGVFSPIMSVLTPRGASAVTASDCAPSDTFVPSGPSNTGPAYCTGPTQCASEGGTYSVSNKTCSITYKPSTLADSKGYDWQVQSYLYYEAMGRCIQDSDLRDGSWSAVSNNGFKWNDVKQLIPAWGVYEWYLKTKDSWVSLVQGQSISYDSSQNYKFFSDPGGPDVGTTVNISPYMRNKLPDGSYRNGNSGTEGAIACSDPAFVKAALTLWGYSSGEQALCDFGFFRENYDPSVGCVTDSSGGKWIKSDHALDTFKTAIQNKIYGGVSPSEYWRSKNTSGAISYAYDRETLFQSCLRGNGDSVPDPLASETLFNAHKDKNTLGYAITNVLDDGVLPTSKIYYIGKLTRTTNVKTVPLNATGFGVSDTELNRTCKDLSDEINNYSSIFSNYIIKFGATATNTDGLNLKTDTSGTTSCPIEGLGWIVCPVINGLSTLNDSMWSLVSSLLTVNPLKQSDAIYNAWKAIRNIANVAFVIVFLIIIFSQLSSIGITNYGVKKMLPRLVIGAILVNVSFIIVQLAVDVSNILGKGVYEAIVSQAPSIVPTWTGLVTTLTTVGIGAGATVAGVAAADGVAAALWVVLPMVAMSALGILAALLTLLFRQAVIPVLAILAPLAFVAFLLPNTESLFKKWRSLLTSMLMLYVTAAFVFAGARFAAAVMFNENEWWAYLTALVVLALPLFSLPFLAKQGGPMLSKVSGALSGLANKAGKPISGWVKPKQDLAREKYQATPASKFNIGKRMNLRGRRMGQVGELKTAAYKAQQAANFSKDLREHTDEYAGQMPKGSVAQSYIKGAASRAEAEALKSEMAPLISEIAAEKARQGSAFELDQHLRDKIKSSSGTQRAAAIHYAASLGRDNIMRELLEPGQDPETKRFAQEAVSANAGSLVSKAPDLVKPTAVAFDTVTGEDLTKFSKDTMSAYVKYLDSLHAAATAPGASQKAKDSLATATASFNSAVTDITMNPTLQAAFSSSSGTAIEKELASVTTSPAFQAYAGSSLIGLAAIQPDGKIR